jgi:predicted O-methyltransferase YrrM
VSPVVGLKASRVPRALRDGWNYPALRLQAATVQTPVDALRSLGFSEERLRAHEREFRMVAEVLYAQLSAAAGAAGGKEAAERLTRPSPSSRDAKKLLYLAVRVLEPTLVVETGPFDGAASTFLLAALDANGGGRLISFDVLAAEDALGVPVAAGREPGWLVPHELRGRFELVVGDTRKTLARRLAKEPGVDLFLHDSLHTFRHMLFEYRVAWRHLSAGGLLVSDDVFWNPAFWLFTKTRRVPFRHIGTVGLTRKPS